MSRFVDGYWAEHFRAPSLREISKVTGIGSLSHISYVLDGMVMDGKLADRAFGTSRQVIPNLVVLAIRSGQRFGGWEGGANDDRNDVV